VIITGRWLWDSGSFASSAAGRLRPSPTSPGATRRIERGLVEPSPETTVALARTFGISIERLRRLLAEAQSEEVSA
jgi:hypothetical protein